MHSDVPALRLVSRMDVGVRAFLDMTDRSSSTPLKRHPCICGHPAALKEAGSGTCAARTGLLCLTARNQVRNHLHVRTHRTSRLAIIPQGRGSALATTPAWRKSGSQISRRVRSVCISTCPSRSKSFFLVGSPDHPTSESIEIAVGANAPIFVLYRFP
jgi:hypothetical protein